MAKLRSAMKKPCNVHTFGFGAQHSESLLQALATTSEGTYYFIENEDSIPTSFGDCLGGLLTVAGQNLKLTIHPLNGMKHRLPEPFTHSIDKAHESSSRSV